MYADKEQRILTEREYSLETYLKEVGKQISKFRKDQKWSLEELGLRIGLDRSVMHNIEAGKRNLTLRTILKLAIVLEKDPSDFLHFPFDRKSFNLSGLNKAEKKVESPSKRKKGTQLPSKKRSS